MTLFRYGRECAAGADRLAENLAALFGTLDNFLEMRAALDGLAYPLDPTANARWDSGLTQLNQQADAFDETASDLAHKVHLLDQEICVATEVVKTAMRDRSLLNWWLANTAAAAPATASSNDLSALRSTAMSARVQVIQAAAEADLDRMWIEDEPPVRTDPDDCDLPKGFVAPGSCRFAGVEFHAGNLGWEDPVEPWAQASPSQRAVNLEPALIENGQVVRTALVLTADLMPFDPPPWDDATSVEDECRLPNQWIIENIPTWPEVFPASGGLQSGWAGSPGGVILTVDYRSRKLSLVIQFDRGPCSPEHDRAWVAERLSDWAGQIDFALPGLTDRATLTADSSFTWLPLRRPSRSCDFIRLDRLSRW